MDCIFCKIIKKEIPAKIVYEDEELLAFNDNNPQAPHHVLIIPRKHIETLNDVRDQDAQLLGKMSLTARDLAQKLGIAQKGYRIVMNCNREAGQAVFHIHLHLLGGRSLSWPPG